MSANNNLVSIDEETCNMCGGRIVSDTLRGEMICSGCGMVRGPNFDATSPESSEFSTSMTVENSKTPTSLMMYDIGLPTFIDKKNIDANGKPIKFDSDIEKLRRLNKFSISIDSKTRNLKKAVKEIVRITEIMGMSPRIAERAGYIYRKALNLGLIRGRSITGIVVATIYIACKDAGVHFPIEQVEKLVENCSKKNVMHYYKLLLRSMKLYVAVPEPTKHLSRISERARLGGKTERRAFEILSQIEGEPSLSGKKPISLAAAALYISAQEVGEHTTQLRIAIASELTTITIRKRCLEINGMLKSRRQMICP
ncbi:MAG: transcription initiation factor IIB [Thaumarchaeota archaeon]|nr:transcription initiation factor IIB [Nitrososphaerota archaeon]